MAVAAVTAWTRTAARRSGAGEGPGRFVVSEKNGRWGKAINVPGLHPA